MSPFAKLAGWPAAVLGGLGLILCLLVAFDLRTRLADAHRVPAGAALPSGSAWLVDDPDACYHLRRVSVGLSSGEIPGYDRFLNHPAGSPVPWPSFFDAALTAVAERLGGVDRQGRVSEGRVDAVLVQIPPILGLLVCLAVAAAVPVFAGAGAAAWLGAVMAALFVATTPIGVWYSSTARIDHHVATALFLALMLLATAFSLRARDPSDAMLGALLSGLLAGFSMLIWLASASFVLICALGFFAASLVGGAEETGRARRSGLLFFLAAAVVVLVPAEHSAWNAVEPNTLVNLSRAVPRALLAGTVPFLALALAARLGWSQLLAFGAAVVATALLVALLPGFADGLREGVDWASRENSFMAQVEESRPLFDGPGGWLGVAVDLGWAAYLAPILVLGLTLAAWRGAHSLVLLLALGLAILFTISQRRFGNSASVPLAIATGTLITTGLRSGGMARLGSLGLTLGVLISSAVTWSGYAKPTTEELADLADWRWHRIAGLQALRSASPWPGSFDQAELMQSYGVLSGWGLGHPIEHHGRRATIATGFGSFVGADNFREHAAALLEGEESEFLGWLEDLGAGCVVVTPRMVSELPSLARIAEWPLDRRRTLFEGRGASKRYSQAALETAVVRLALHDHSVGSEGFAGLKLVHASGRYEFPSGLRAPVQAPGSGPVVSVYVLPSLAAGARPGSSEPRKLSMEALPSSSP